ncbi:MAG TPA: hypothetical protein RMH99_12545 [Sandaracinaceae bacterium LLY-WYZ-13_1]|nr:hypothetical protein [Sandaracinaceae bacterium LLY-WYZ-13_1]
MADEELSALAALMLGSAAGVPSMMAAGPVGILLGVATAASVFGYAEVRRWLHRDGARGFQLRRQLRAVGPPRPIGRSRSGRCRVRGRVKVLEPVDLDGASCAAWWSRRVEVERRFDGLSRSGRPVHIFEERQACGRLAVVDETGLAIVDGARAGLWCESTFAVFGPRGGVLRVRDGDLVEVVGHARRAFVPDVGRLAPSGYRSAGSRLLFDRAPLVLLREPRRDEE